MWRSVPKIGPRERWIAQHLVYDGCIAIRAVWRESFTRTAEGATARKRSGTRTADSRDLWRAIAAQAVIHRRGAALQRRAISQVKRTEGQGTSVLVSLYSFAARLQWA